jgi:nucleoside-diphosphate-sugar epimerase
LEETRLRKPTAVFNYISSWFVYGSNEIPFKESQCCKPNGFYSITKYAGELLLRSFCETYNLKFRIIRLGNIVGPGDKKASLKKNAVQFMTRKILNGEDINLYEGGEVIRDFLHIDDAVRGIDLILEKGALNEIYNLSSGVGVKVGDILREFRALVGSNSKFNNIRTPDFHNRVQARNSVLDITKVMELGFEVLRPVTGKDFLEK